MATHSSILAWKILWTEEPGRLQSIGSQRLGHDSTHTHTHTQNPLPGTEREIPLVNVNFSYQRVTLT